jgi:hypothetical protein
VSRQDDVRNVLDRRPPNQLVYAVMAGSWEPLLFRARRDGKGYVPAPEQLADWQREHSAEMAARLYKIAVVDY